MSGIRALSLAAVLAVSFIFPAGASAGCLPEDPECRPAPPQTAEVRPDPRRGSGELGKLADPALVKPLPMSLPMPLPRRVGEEAVSAKGGDLAREQDPTDVTCGAQALGKAMDRLGGVTPTSTVMIQYLRDQGWLYEYGTGVEELALTAQAYGYSGSESFHGWDLRRLHEELDGGRSVVVSLGVNGPDAPGHFVTVTDVSPDGRWVTYDDPVLGVRVVSTEEFQAQRYAQGNSGVVVRRGPTGAGSALPGEGPLVPLGLATAALAGVAALAPLGTKRKGIGGHVNPPGVAGRWVQREEPVYADVTEVVGYDVKREPVPRYKTVQVQEGWDVETVPVARTKTVVVQDGWDVQTVRKPIYRTESYISGYRTWTQRVPEYDYIGRRRKLIGYDYVTRREAIWSTRAVVAGYQTVEKREPRLVTKEVFDHWDYEEKRVPHMVPKQVPDGYDEVPVRVPITVTRSKQVGTRVKWVWEANGQAQTGTDDDYRVPLSQLDYAGMTAIRASDPGARREATPVALEDIWLPEMPPLSRETIIALGKGVRLANSMVEIDRVASLTISGLPSGKVSVGVSSAVAEGERAALRRELGYIGTRYNPATLAEITGNKLLDSSVSKGSLGLGTAFAIAGNVYEYGWGGESEKGIASTEFVASTAIDIGTTVATGVVSAGVVALAIGALALVGVAAVPLAAAIATTAIIGLGVGALFSRAVEEYYVKERVAEGLSSWGGIASNAELIVNTLGEEAYAIEGAGRVRPGMK